MNKEKIKQILFPIMLVIFIIGEVTCFITLITLHFATETPARDSHYITLGYVIIGMNVGLLITYILCKTCTEGIDMKNTKQESSPLTRYNDELRNRVSSLILENINLKNENKKLIEQIDQINQLCSNTQIYEKTIQEERKKTQDEIEALPPKEDTL